MGHSECTDDWEVDGCGDYKRCVPSGPSDSDKSYCSCEYSINQLSDNFNENGELTCKLTAFSISFAIFWALLGLVLFHQFAVALQSLVKIRQAGLFRWDAITCTTTFLILFDVSLMVTSFTMAVGVVLIESHPGSSTTIRLLFTISQGIAFFNHSNAMVFYAVTVLHALSTSARAEQMQKRNLRIASVYSCMYLALFATLGGEDSWAVLAIVVVVLVVIVFILFAVTLRRITRSQAQLGSTQETLDTIRQSLTQTMGAMAVLLVCLVGFVMADSLGRIHRSRLAVSHMAALAVAILYSSTVVMAHMIAKHTRTLYAQRRRRKASDKQQRDAPLSAMAGTPTSRHRRAPIVQRREADILSASYANAIAVFGRPLDDGKSPLPENNNNNNNNNDDDDKGGASKSALAKDKTAEHGWAESDGVRVIVAGGELRETTLQPVSSDLKKFQHKQQSG